MIDHRLSVSLGLDSSGKPVMRARCTCGWVQEERGMWKSREEAETAGRDLFDAHVDEDGE